MLSDLIKEEFEPRLFIGLYVGGVIIILSMLINQHLTGLYQVVLPNFFILISFIFAALYVYVLRNQRIFIYVVYPVSIILGLVTLWQIAYHPNQGLQFFYLTPIFLLFYIPLRKTFMIGLCVALLSLIIISINQSLLLAMRVMLYYLLILSAGYFFMKHLAEKKNHLKGKSLIDPISQGYKESHYQTLLKRELARCRHDNQELSLISIVIDDYERLQELHGRRALIQFLPEFVAEIQAQVRVVDDIFRIKDDSFIIMLTHCPEDGASALMGRIMNNLQRRQWPPFTDIILICAYVTCKGDETYSELNLRLDKKLNKQKRANKTISAIEPNINESKS